MKSVSVFCASSSGNHPIYETVATELGQRLARENITVVYGGSNVGLMGAVADAALAEGGRVIGMLPKFLAAKEIAHRHLTELILCETMHERKTKMFEHSEGFIALPGGFGTLEEVVEILTWGQLGLHRYPICFLNVNGYYDHLKALFETMSHAGLLRTENHQMALFATTVEKALEKMRAYVAPTVSKWIPKTEKT